MSVATETQPNTIPAENGLEDKLAAVEINGQASAGSSIVAFAEEKPPKIIKTPIVEPHHSVRPPTPQPLSPEHEAKYNELLEIVKSWKEVPSTKGKEGPITDDEIFWLTRECLLRYLRATKWTVTDAAKRILGTLTWRREYGVPDLTPEHISPENETGKQIIMGYDVNGRVCHYLNPGRQNTSTSPRQVQHLVFMLERVIDMMHPGQDTLALLINFKSSKSRSNTSPPLATGKEVLHILQTHYPERLGRACVINIPWLVSGFLKLITPFIDPMTREKLKFNEDVRNYVPAEHLWTEFNGDLEFEYDHDEYWPSLMNHCNEKKAEQKARWEKAGKHYGESETYIRGGDVPSVHQKAETEQKQSADENTPETAPVEAPVQA